MMCCGQARLAKRDGPEYIIVQEFEVAQDSHDERTREEDARG